MGVQLVILDGMRGELGLDLKPMTFNQKIKAFLFPRQDPKSWFDCPEDEFKEKVEFLTKKVTSPYLTSLFYDKFDQLTDVPLHLISAEYCTFLDDSITMAKLWKGPLKSESFRKTLQSS